MWFTGFAYPSIYRYTLCICEYALYERLKLVDFKIFKTVSKNLNEEDQRQSENEEFQAIKRVILFLV